MTPASRLRSGLALALLASLAGTRAGAQTPNEGVDYKVVRQVSPAPNPKRVLVEEFFWYGCPHCFHADPLISAWDATKAADVDFTRLPLTLGRPGGENQVRSYYVAQALGVENKTHRPMFDAIHVQGKPMSTPEESKALFAQVAGVKPAQFDQLYNSFTVTANYQGAESKAMQYGVTGVPTIVVGGKYTFTAGKPDTGSLINFLVDKVRKERGLPAPSAAPMASAAPSAAPAEAPTAKKAHKKGH